MTAAVQAGCGSGSCGCGGHDGASPVPSVNGFTLAIENEHVDDDTLRERAWSELLRQEAVRRQLLPAHVDSQAPALSAGDQRVIEAMLDDAVQVAEPSEDECRRYYEARQEQFVEGAQVHARHILFAVTDGVDVRKLAARAEQALLELTHRDVAPGRFAELARECSNCPTGAQGGDLGWVGPHGCSQELAQELFHGHNRRALGLRPRLVHSRYGFHVIEVLARRPGRQATFDEVSRRIAMRLAQQARAKALNEYMQALANASAIEGVPTVSPLVQ